jgi:protease-4
MSRDLFEMEGRREPRRPFAFLRAIFGIFTFWRVFAVIVFLFIVGAAQPDRAAKGPFVARLWVTGLIVDDPARDKLIAGLKGDDDVTAVIVRIDSPGGTTAGSEALYLSLRDLAADKPVIAVLGGVAASGGYIAAIAADRIVARGNTMTASIGVIMQYPDLTGLLSNVGVEMQEIKSSPLKAAPSPFTPATEAAIQVQRDMIADGYAWFRGLVSERRGLEGAALDAVADGRVVSGRMALAAGLVDEIGGEDAAISWLKDVRGVTDKVRDARVAADDDRRLLDLLLSHAGLSGASDLLSGPARRALMGPRLMSVLD